MKQRLNMRWMLKSGSVVLVIMVLLTASVECKTCKRQTDETLFWRSAAHVLQRTVHAQKKQNMH